LTTSAGTLALILAMMSGVLALVVALALAWPITASSVLALVVGVATLATIVAWSFRYYGRVQRTLRVAFPSAPGDDPSRESQSVR
jgi:membrane protein YdbS with pleckstrin-like domain